MNPALRDAAQELAEREHRSQFPAALDHEDALPYVDADLCGQWFAHACAEQNPDFVMMDIIESCNAQEASAIFAGLFRDNDLARFTLANVARRYIANQIARAADELREKMDEPEDVWDDPVRADRRAIANGRRDF